MVDILKITSPISIKSKVQNLPSKLPTDAVFDITNQHQIVNELPKTKGAEDENGKQSLLKNLNKEIFEPLLNSTKAQADGLRKLVLMAKFFETSSGILSESFLDKVFVRPQEMLGELVSREKGATIFNGEFFDSLRILTKLEGQPKLKGAVVSILKHFECYVHQENSLKAIITQAQDLVRNLPKAEAQVLLQQIDTLDTMVKLNTMVKHNVAVNPENTFNKSTVTVNSGTAVVNQEWEKQTEIKSFLKNEIIPQLGKIVKRHQGSEKIYNQEMAIVHNIVRYDKADPKLLEEAVFQLGDELKLLTNLTDEDVLEMKKVVFEQAKVEQKMGEKPQIDKMTMEKFGIELDDNDMATLLSKALDKSEPAKINNVAQNLLQNMVQNENPLIQLMHFTIPFRYMDENTYGEFFVDKEGRGRKGNAKDAKNIFFTIQSDKYGNFEVDLLARDNKIDLDIRCPDNLLNPVRETKGKLREIIEEQGFRLTNYQVGVYQESQTIIQRFPKLALRKVGIDVKV